MREAWSTLIEAGLPDGPARPKAEVALRAKAVGEAVHRLRQSPPTTTRNRELLAAWLAAFRHHWQSEFASVCGDDGLALLALLGQASDLDANRYLKQRRIAIANLAAARRLP